MNQTHITRLFGGFFAFILCWCSLNLASQIQPNYFIKSKKDGLQSNTVYFIHVAKSGLLYVAHSKGLSSFDGFAFNNFYNKSFPFTEVSNILETDDGVIFCKAFNNVLYKLNENDTLVQERWFPTRTGFSPSGVYKNTILGISNDSIVFYNPQTRTSESKSIHSISFASEFNDIIFCAYAKIDSGFGFVFVDKSLKCFKSKSTKNIEGKMHFNNGQVFLVKDNKHSEIFNLVETIKGSITVKAPKTFVNYITYFDNQVWICTTDGLYYQEAKSENNTSLKKLLPGYNISNIVKTQDNTYLASTIGNGLISIPSFEVVRYMNLPEKLQTLTGNHERLYIGAHTGNTLIYDLKENKIDKEIIQPSQKKSSIIIYDTISKTLITSGLTTTFYNSLNSFSVPFTIKDYCYTKDGIVFATNAGLYYLSTKLTKPWWMRYKDNTVQINPYIHRLTYFNEPVYSILYNPIADNFFLNSYQGNFEINQHDNHPKRLPDPDCVLSDIKYYRARVLLFTKDKGILEWKNEKYISAFQNAPKGIFYKAAVFNNELWILAEDALYHYDGTNFIKYDNKYGIETDGITSFYVGNKEIYINNSDYIIRFPINISRTGLREKKFILNKVINRITHKEVGAKAVIPFDENSLKFEFALLNYTNGINTHIAYSINNEDLIHLSNSHRQIQLNQLSPDYYQIKFYIVEDNQIPETPCYTFAFQVSPPFYKTWWFISILILTLTALIISVSRSILFRWKKEARLLQAKLILEKELDKSMLSSIKSQMNPHFLFNALNTIQSYIYMNDKHNASVYISKFSDLTRNILEFSNKDTITLEEEIATLMLYLDLEKMRFEESFEYEINYDKNLKKEVIKIPSMLIQPYVENAIKHGLLHKKNERKLLILFKEQNEQLLIKIDDNGIGRKRSQELNEIRNKKHKSFAMDANKKRLDILKNNYKSIAIKIDDKYSSMGEPIGTCVSITLPLNFTSQT